MWLIAQEKMKALLDDLGARLIDNVVLADQGKSLYTFVTTPRWLLTGKKDAFWFFPKAGIYEEEIASSSRFGARLCDALQKNEEQEKILEKQGFLLIGHHIQKKIKFHQGW